MRWFVGAGLVLLVALILGSGLLAYAMYVLFAVLLVSRYLTHNWTAHVKATRTCDRETAEVGETASLRVALRNTSWMPIPWLLVEDLFPPGSLSARLPRLKVRGKRLKMLMLPPNGTATMSYRLEFLRRGYYQLGPVLLETGDLFGLHRRYRVEDRPHFVLVYPRIVPLQGYDIASRRPVGEVRLTHRLYEDPTRIAGVRRYEVGDPLSRVHWKATARTGVLHCKTYEPSTMAGATILLDFHLGGYHDRGEPYRSELAVTAAASLAHAVFVMGQQVGFISNGRDAADRIRLEGWEGEFRDRQNARQTAEMEEADDRLRPLVVPTGRGADQFHRIREVLARLELTDGLPFDALVMETASRLPRDASVVAVLPDVPEATALALGSLKRMGLAVTVVLVLLPERDLENCHGRLLAEGIRDVRHLASEEALTELCQRQVEHPAPYQFLSS